MKCAERKHILIVHFGTKWNAQAQHMCFQLPILLFLLLYKTTLSSSQSLFWIAHITCWLEGETLRLIANSGMDGTGDYE